MLRDLGIGRTYQYHLLAKILGKAVDPLKVGS